MRLLTMIAASLSLVACASGQRRAEAPAPSYKEHVGVVSQADVRDQCPADVGGGVADWRALVPIANACVAAGQWGKVEVVGNLIATRAPLAPWGAYYLSLSASSRKDFARAQWMLQLALKKAPDQPIFHFELGRLYWQLGDEAGVMNEMKTAANLSPELADAHVFLGQISLRRNDLGDARREFRAALAAGEANPAALLGLAQTEVNAGDFVAAEDLLARATKSAPRNAAARLALAEIRENQLKKIPEALETLREFARLAREQKLDGTAPANLGQRIQGLEKTLSQVKHDGQASLRQPSAEGTK